MDIFRQWAWSFLSIVFESLPFILIGAIFSTLIQIFVSEEIIEKILPRNKLLGFIIASIIGLIVPICECAIVPIARSLIKKKLPVGIAITFMISVPIINPLVIASTYIAFDHSLYIVILRSLGGILCSITIGIIISLVFKEQKVENIISDEYIITCSCCANNSKYYTSKFEKLIDLICNSSKEFLNISIYVIVGAVVSSVFNVIINENILCTFTFNPVISITVMLLLSFLLSLCSEADAFVASKFMNNFGLPSILGFLILGPMMDLKNAILTFGLFKRKFAIVLVNTIFIIVTCFTALLYLLL